jgi:parvulin-like peptidyl-prolyl isomerase
MDAMDSRIWFLLGAFLFLPNPVHADVPPVATVGNKNITLEEFNRRYEEVVKLTVNPPSKKLFLEDLIRYEVGVQEAEKRNLAKDPVVAERLRQELYKSLIEKELGKRIEDIKVSDQEMKDFYKSNPEIRTRHILIEIKPKPTAAERATAKKRAEEILSEVKKSKKPFQELVGLYTDDLATKKNGGDVGFQTRLSVLPAYYEAALKLRPGEVSSVVETPYGFHIIELIKKNSFNEANKRQVKAAVFEKKRLSLFNEYFDKVKKSYAISINWDPVK